VTKNEYLDEVRFNLSVLPKDEVDMAIRFYDEYLSDAGPEHESAAMEELGKPYHLAKSIISEQSAFTRSAMYIEHTQNRKTPKAESIFAYAEPPKENFPNRKRADDVHSNSIDLTKERPAKNEPPENISRRAFMLGMTAIICVTILVMFIVGMVISN
jgi:uncharacterized membrane protein